MKHSALFAGLAALLPLALFAQLASRPAFEVASVKPNDSGAHLSKWDPDHHGNFDADNTSLKWLISSAYEMAPFMVSGPDWLDSLKYDVHAKGIPGTPDAEVCLMLQRLLEERFHLKTHRETKEMSVFFLELARGGLKAEPANPSKPDNFQFPPGSWRALQISDTMGRFSGLLSTFAGRPVLDRTGLRDKFNLRLWFNDSMESQGPDLPTALREELGLILRSGRGPVEILVVDAAEKVPTQN